MLENGSILKKADQFILARDVLSLEVPDTIQGIIAARMDRLEDSLKMIMQVAAVIGREFAFRILEIITEMQEDIKAGLLNLQDLEFIYEKSLFPELEYIFKHALTQEVAYNSLLLKRRKEIHEQIGQAIERLYPDRLEEFYEMLAYHYSKSNNRTKAYEYLKLSAKKAIDREALWEAFRLYGDAADTLSQFSETWENKSELVQILLSMTAPIRMLGYPEDSVEYLQQCEDAAKEINDTRTSAHILSLIGLYHCTKGNPREGSVCVENAFREAQKSGDVSLIAPIGYDLIVSYLSRREMMSLLDTADRVLPVIAQAQRQRERFGRPTYVYPIIQNLKGWAMVHLGDFTGGQSLIAEGLALATEINHIFTIAHVEVTDGWSYALKGDAQACEDHCQLAVRFMEQIQTKLWLGLAYTGIGQACYLSGRFEEGIEYIEKGMEIQSGVGTLMWMGRHYLYLGEIYFEIGEMTKARGKAEEALVLARKGAEKDHEALSKILLGRVAAREAKSHLDEAERNVLEGIRILQEQRLKPNVSIGYLHLGQVYLDVGQTKKSSPTAQEGRGHVPGNGDGLLAGKGSGAAR